MTRFVPLEKRSKKAQRACYQMMRGSWHGFSPVTRIVPNKKRYQREKRVSAYARD